jgi:hypothetical protein
MPDTKVLRVERGERIVLSPESPRFRENYLQIRPRTASEVREVLGLSAEVAQALHDRGVRSRRSAHSSATVAVEDLDSRDEVARTRARCNTGNALQDYVYAINPQFLSQMEPVFVKYLEYWQPLIKIAVLPDIEVADGGTMMISADTNVVRANNIVVSGTGKIVCLGPMKFEANSIVGN